MKKIRKYILSSFVPLMALPPLAIMVSCKNNKNDKAGSVTTDEILVDEPTGIISTEGGSEDTSGGLIAPGISVSDIPTQIHDEASAQDIKSPTPPAIVFPKPIPVIAPTPRQILKPAIKSPDLPSVVIPNPMQVIAPTPRQIIEPSIYKVPNPVPSIALPLVAPIPTPSAVPNILSIEPGHWDHALPNNGNSLYKVGDNYYSTLDGALKIAGVTKVSSGWINEEKQTFQTNSPEQIEDPSYHAVPHAIPNPNLGRWYFQEEEQGARTYTDEKTPPNQYNPAIVPATDEQFIGKYVTPDNKAVDPTYLPDYSYEFKPAIVLRNGIEYELAKSTEFIFVNGKPIFYNNIAGHMILKELFPESGIFSAVYLLRYDDNNEPVFGNPEDYVVDESKALKLVDASKSDQATKELKSFSIKSLAYFSNGEKTYSSRPKILSPYLKPISEFSNKFVDITTQHIVDTPPLSPDTRYKLDEKEMILNPKLYSGIFTNDVYYSNVIPLINDPLYREVSDGFIYNNGYYATVEQLREAANISIESIIPRENLIVTIDGQAYNWVSSQPIVSEEAEEIYT